jgi:hypothetical protein
MAKSTKVSTQKVKGGFPTGVPAGGPGKSSASKPLAGPGGAKKGGGKQFSFMKGK